MATPNNKPRWLFNAVLACTSVIALLLLTEFVLSVLVPLVYRPRFTQLDDVVGWYHTRSVSGTDELEGHRYTISYNSHGYRAPEHAYAKPIGTQRVVVLGDSFTDGSEVGDDELFTRKLEQALPGVEVVNLGVYGYQTAQELVTLEDRGLRYSPDAVVLITVPNDLRGNVVGLESFGPAPRFVLSGSSLAFEGLDHPNSREAFRIANLPTPSWIYRNSTVYYFLNNYIFQRLMSDRIRQFADQRLAAVSLDDQQELYRRIVLRMSALCRSRGIPLLVVLTHQRNDVTASDRSQFDSVAKSLRSAGVKIVDLFEPLREQQLAGPSPFYRGDPHWNVIGHERVALWLTEPIKSILAYPSSIESSTPDR